MSALPPGFLLVVLLAMLGIPLYLVAYGGFSGTDLSGMMRSTDEAGLKEEDEEDKTSGGNKKKRSNEDPGSPLDISDLGGLGVLIGISALVVLGFTLFPQEINGLVTTLTGAVNFSSFSPWQGDASGSHVRQSRSSQALPTHSQQTVKSGPVVLGRRAASVDTIARHLRLLRAQPILLVGYNEDHAQTIAVVLGFLAIIPAMYVFGQLVWDAQDLSVRQDRLDASLKMQDEEMRKAEMLGKRAELFEEDAKRIRKDQLNMIEEIKKAPPWWGSGKFEDYKQRELARRREETNVLADRATQKAALFKRRQTVLEERWQPKETTRNGKTEKEDNLFPGVPLLSYMRKRSSGKESKTPLDVKGMLGQYPDLSKLVADTEDLISRSKMNSEGKAEDLPGKLKYMGANGSTSLRLKMYSRWWEEDKDKYDSWKGPQNADAQEEAEYDAEEQRMRVELDKKIREKLMRGEKIEHPKGKRLEAPSQSEVRAAVRADETSGSARGNVTTTDARQATSSSGWKNFIKAIAP